METKNVTLAHGLKLEADTLVKDEKASDYEAAFLAGGYGGSKNFGASEDLKKFLHELRSQNKTYGAICAAPVLSLAPLGMLEGVTKATCYPGMENMFPAHVTASTDVVVKSGHCLTSRGPGTTLFFGLAIAALLVSKETAEKLAKDLLVDHFPETKTAISAALS
ncbi:4-methyl-5(b-hydroxyethyl)-thiazole monophosphate biosynthesis [Angomonas deanei]|nr:4-methyl-5(b-hydroxyethyl)-thiazole monophosphate biosynthesis [Angomonas deanei]|eukprot:EPY43545.1 4-methyl-5(b-hydroxyethyl)-thiazole monophosphate biosynthesis [Angomonas deanei]